MCSVWMIHRTRLWFYSRMIDGRLAGGQLLVSRRIPAHSGGVGVRRIAERFTYPQDFTVRRIAKSITASEIPSAASTVTTEDPWLECFAASRISAERARCRSYSLRLGLSRFPLRLLFLFVRVLFLALFLILLAAFVAHFIILCYCELSFRKIRSTRIMSPTGSVLSNRIQWLSWTSCERFLSLDRAGASEHLRRIASAAGVCPFPNNRHVD